MRSANKELPFVFVLAALVCIYSISCEQTLTNGQGFKEPSASGISQEDEQLATNTIAALNRAANDGSLAVQTAANPLRANSRLLAVPLSLARFMFPHSRQAGGNFVGDHQAQAPLMTTGAFGGANNGQNGVSNSKRSSSSQLSSKLEADTLLGLSGLGKRSVPVEYINLEPIFRRQNLVRGNSRIQNIRWQPVDVGEAPMATSDY